MRHESTNLTHLLERRWRDLLHTTSVTESTFGTSVREHYEATVPEHARSIEWSTHPDLVSRMRRDAEKINRWFREDVHARFPVEAFESFVVAFPSERRFALQIEIAARQNLLVIPMPISRPGADTANLGAIAKETGEAIVALSYMLADGVIDHRDSHKVGDAVTQIDEAMAVLASMRERIQQRALSEPAAASPRSFGVVDLKSPAPR